MALPLASPSSFSSILINPFSVVQFGCKKNRKCIFEKLPLGQIDNFLMTDREPSALSFYCTISCMRHKNQEIQYCEERGNRKSLTRVSLSQTLGFSTSRLLGRTNLILAEDCISIKLVAVPEIKVTFALAHNLSLLSPTSESLWAFEPFLETHE